MNISSKKTEQKAITKLNELIDYIETADSNIQKNDKTISWDGTIDFYKGKIDFKDNYEFSVDVQVKGRTKYKKKLNDKDTFDISVSDLKNYLKKDGTILFQVVFKNNSDESKIYYISLLPYDIYKLLRENNTSLSTIKVKMREVKDYNHLEIICRNFQLNKDRQKRMSKEMFNQNSLQTSTAKTVEFSVWEKNLISPVDLIGTEQYFYTMSEDDYPIGVDLGIISNLVEKLENMIISDFDKSVVYNDAKRETDLNNIKITFGKAFYFDLNNNTFNVKINGSFKERLKQLDFVVKALKNKGFYINNEIFKLEAPMQHMFEERLNQYINLKKILEKHNIMKDLKFDDWDNKDFDRLNLWLSAIEYGMPLNLASDIDLMGSIQIKDLRLSVIARKDKNNKFKVESLWNVENHNKYYFKYVGYDQEIETNMLYLVLNKEAYMSDDINIEEMKKVIESHCLENEEYLLLNLQVLEILKAYDCTKKHELLEYAEWLVNILMRDNEESFEVYYINYCQILKRDDRLTETEMTKLIEIKEKTKSLETKLWCNILLENKNEANILLRSFDEETLKILKQYPISIYL